MSPAVHRYLPTSAGLFRLATALLATTMIWSALSTSVRSDDPVSSNVRFNREIIRILQRRCLSCHLPGGLSIPLGTYRQVRDWSRAIREELVEQRMPPRSAAPGYGRFENAPGLTSREMATMLTWLDGGMPQGDEADLPASLEPITGETPRDAADLRLDLPEQHVPALEELVIRRVTISTTLTADRLVSRVVVRPGVRAVLRGALVYLGPDEQSWVGAWLPWQQTFASPLSRGFRISNGSALNVALYYRGGEQPIVDRPAVELHFAENRQPLDTLWIDTTDASVGSSPSGAARTGRLTLPSRTTIWALHSMVRTATDSLEVRARRPDGSIEVLLWMPRVQDEWPNVLVLQEPMTFPAGSVLTVSTRARDSGGPTDRVMIAGWRETEANAPPARQPPP